MNADDAVFPGYGDEKTSGMTLRDYFAGQALAGFCSQEWPTFGDLALERWPETIGRASYDLADAMLRAREKSE